ncbi:MAG TPA: copper homeostasis protein CutC [Chitinophagaceae bacterium]
MNDAYKLEVIAFTLESCRTIQSSGAHRIELCDNAAEGGTTASYGMIRAARELVTIDLFPIIRPRGGDFLYSDEEFAIMKQDVTLCRQLGCDGVVVGLLTRNGRIDIKRTAQLVEMAYPLEVTFHRAFDHCADPFEALDQLVQIGCQRILTSGQHPTAPEGAGLLARLVKAADDRIIVMPGSGVRVNNIKALADETGAREFHSSLRSRAKTNMEFIHPAFPDAGESYSHPTVTGDDIKELLKALNS